jgi:multidrug efflux pump
MILFLSAPGLNRLQLTDYAERYLVERFSTVPGVANVRIFGEQQYAMRIEIDADALAARGLTVADIETALSTQNAELPAGTLEGQDKDFTIRIARGYATAQDFMQLPIAARSGASASTAARAVAGAEAEQVYVSRLGDIARVVETSGDRRRLFRGNGKDQIGLAVTRQSQANDLAISEGVRAAMEEVRGGLPEGSNFVVAVDNSEFTAEAIHEVYITIGISLALVGLVNFLFLGTLRAAIIPTVVAPICLLATFIVLAPLGFSLNLLTLLALVLAVGLVVDDAIVVVENIQRRVDMGEPPAVGVLRRGRHHCGADRRLRALALPARLHRPAVRRVGRGDRGGRRLLRLSGPEPVAHAGVQAVAARQQPGLARAQGRRGHGRAPRQLPQLPAADGGPSGPCVRRERPDPARRPRRLRAVQGLAVRACAQ